VLKELAADDSATDWGKSRNSIERALQCEYMYISKTLSVDHLKDQRGSEEKLVLESITAFKNFEE
jgi:hypothetical protein